MTSNRETNHYEQGQHDAIAYYSSPSFAQFTRDVKAEDAIKLFLPVPRESLSQMATPYPKPIQDWLDGFQQVKDEQGVMAWK